MLPKVLKNRFTSFLCIFMLIKGLFSYYQMSPELYKKIEKGTDLAFNDHLLEALNLFQNIKHEMPDNPVGYFFEVAVLEKIQTDYMTQYQEEELKNKIETAIKVAGKFLKTDPQNALANFYMGAIQGYKSLHYYRTENDISVFIDALRALNHLKKAHERDPTLWDVYYGLGIYKYWKAEIAPFLNFFGINSKTNKQEGISYLKLAIKNGIFSKAEARGALAQILINEKRYAEALKLINQAIEKYPNSLYQYRYRLEIYVALNQWEYAYNDCQKIEKLISQKSYAGPYAWLFLYYNKGLAAMKLDKNDDAIMNFQAVINVYKIHKKSISSSFLVSKSKKLLKKLQKKLK